MGGDRDAIPSAQSVGWSAFTTGKFEHQLFPGGHFYYDESPN